MAYSTINKSTDYFNTKLYTGNGTTNTAQTGVGFQPDWTWIKARSVGYDNNLFDAVRGSTKRLIANANTAETTQTEMIKSFNSDGFTLGNDAGVNANSATFASWNWKANGQGSSNTAGSINTTYTSVNTTAGLSISKYDGTGANATFGHGLGVKPDIVFWKRLDSNDGAVNWIVQSPILGNQNKLVLNTADATSTGSSFSQTNNWTNTLIDLKTYEGENDSNATYIAYAFASKTGYSKIGSYTGNGSSDGTFVYTGFKPAFIMTKCSTSGSTNWSVMDNKRFGYNVTLPYVYANTTGAEETTQNVNNIDILSNGFKCRESDSNRNASGSTYIFMAFGQSIVGSNNIPATAR